MSKGVTLYYDTICGPCRMALMVIRQLGIDDKIDFKLTSLRNKDHLTPEFVEINPSKCLPTLVDNELGITLWESRAIIQYLVNKFSPNSSLYPTDVKTRALIDRHLYQDATSFFPTVGGCFGSIYHRKVKPTTDAVDGVKAKLALMDKIIGTKKFAVGDSLTLADVSMLVTLCYVEMMGDVVGIDISEHSNVKNYFEGLKKEVTDFDVINKEPIAKVKGYLLEALAQCQ